MILTIPAPCAWLNSNQRLHRMAAAKLTAQWRAAGKQAATDLEPVEGQVRILAYISKPRGGRWDPNNLWPTIKALVDGIVDAGLIPDDDHEHLIGPDMRRGPKAPAAITLHITPAGDSV